MSNNKLIRLFGISDDSIVDGPGIRYSIFTQGCAHKCPGCHNPKAQPFEGGKMVSTDTLWKKIEGNPLLAGITLTGGEPFDQAEVLVDLAQRCKAKRLTVWAYSGYFFEDLLAKIPTPASLDLLREVDVLVDGLYKEDLRSLELRWRGSSNQRIIDVAASLAANDVVEWRSEGDRHGA